MYNYPFLLQYLCSPSTMFLFNEKHQDVLYLKESNCLPTAFIFINKQKSCVRRNVLKFVLSFPVIDMSRRKSTEREDVLRKCLLCVWLLKASGQNPSIIWIIKGDNIEKNMIITFFSS